MCFCKGFKVVWILKECNWKKYCFFDSMVLTFGQSFLFPSSNTVFETICPQWKAFRASKCRRTKSELICENGDSGTWKKFRKKSGQEAVPRKDAWHLSEFKVSWSRTGEKRPWKVPAAMWSAVSPMPIQLEFVSSRGLVDFVKVCPVVWLHEPRGGQQREVYSIWG